MDLNAILRIQRSSHWRPADSLEARHDVVSKELTGRYRFAIPGGRMTSVGNVFGGPGVVYDRVTHEMYGPVERAYVRGGEIHARLGHKDRVIVSGNGAHR